MNDGYMKADKNIFERNPKKTILLAIMVLALILDVSITKIVTFYKEQAKEQARKGVARITTKHEVYHHTFKKNSVTEASFRDRKYYVYTNSLGFKDKSSRTIPISSNKKRIVFIGDSFTEGVSLNYEDTFVGMIDVELKGKGIEVLNAGRSSYGALIYWRKIKYLIEDVGLKFGELVVFVDLADGYNDIFWYQLTKDGNVTHLDSLYLGHWNERDPRHTPARAVLPKLKYQIKGNSTLLYHFLEMINYFDAQIEEIERQERIGQGKEKEIQDKEKKRQEKEKKRSMGRWDTVITSKVASWTVDENLYKEWGQKGVEREIAYMDMLLKLLRSNNIKLTVAVFPWPTQVWYEDMDSIQVRVWEEWCLNNDVKFVNYFPDFVRKGLSDEEKIRVLEKYYLPWDVHFNKQGNRLITRKFLSEYFQNNQ